MTAETQQAFNPPSPSSQVPPNNLEDEQNISKEEDIAIAKQSNTKYIKEIMRAQIED